MPASAAPSDSLSNFPFAEDTRVRHKGNELGIRNRRCGDALLFLRASVRTLAVHRTDCDPRAGGLSSEASMIFACLNPAEKVRKGNEALDSRVAGLGGCD